MVCRHNLTELLVEELCELDALDSIVSKSVHICIEVQRADQHASHADPTAAALTRGT